MLQTYHLHEHIPRCALAAAGTHFWPVCLGSGWKLHNQEPPEGEQGQLRAQGSPVAADCGSEAAGVGGGKQPGDKGAGREAWSRLLLSLSPELWSTQNLTRS